MDWTIGLHFLGGALLANGVPHFVHGISGRRFPTPFAAPPGRGESPPIANLLWGFTNLVGGWMLIHVGVDDAPRTSGDQAAIALGVLLAGAALAWWFGKTRAAAA